MPERFRSWRRPGNALLLAASLTLFTASWGALHDHVFRKWLRGDLIFYENWGLWTTNHRIPYKDFSLEYPPGALPTFVFPTVARSKAHEHGMYDEWFRIEMLVLGLLTIVLMWIALGALRAGQRRHAAALGLAALTPLAIGPILVARYDLWPALLTVVAVVALVAGRRRWSAVAIGAGAAAKIYPVVLLPLLVIETWRRRGAREAAVVVAAFVAVAAAAFVPFVVIAPDGLYRGMKRQATRPLQVESLGAAGFVAAHHLAGVRVKVVKSHGSDNISGRAADAVATISGILVVLALVLVYVRFARAPPTRESIAVAFAAAIVAYVAFNKVYSPQYLTWIFPLVLLVGGRRGLWAGALLALMIALTHAYEPYTYHLLESRLAPLQSALMIARDVVTVALFAVLVLAFRERERAAPRTP